jgi:tRNA-specific 2-thiouridylase
MSGGVDSSVAAALLVQQGYDVIGMMMRLWSEPSGAESRMLNRCCTPDQMADARHIAQQLDIPFYVLDTQAQFRATIVQSFIDDHRVGLTPNPCINCNRQIRFTYLLEHAQALGAQYLATGHYARIRSTDGRFQLLKGADVRKDQSYVLHVLSQDKLAHVLFPVGEYTKDGVRALAREFGLPVASKHDSQDLCFVADGDYRGFLERHNEQPFLAGPIIDQADNELGQHDGLPFYTIGQRKGLGIAAAQPLYVLEKDLARNALIVGPREALQRMHFVVRELNWISGTVPAPDDTLQVKIRYKARAIPCHIAGSGEGEIQVLLAEPATGITPGQGAVFYNNEVCLGGGIIAGEAQWATHFPDQIQQGAGRE